VTGLAAKTRNQHPASSSTNDAIGVMSEEDGADDPTCSQIDGVIRSAEGRSLLGE
jgi:hypothetical protein